MRLNDAAAIYIGDVPVSAVHLGGEQIWPSGVTYTADWSTAWGPEWTQMESHSGGTLTVSGGAGIATPSLGSNRSVYARLDSPLFDDFSALIGVGPHPTVTRQVLFAFRWAGESLAGSFPRDCYLLRGTPGSSALQLWRYAGSGGQRLDNVPFAAIPATPFWIRLEAAGSTLRYRWWEDGDPEPAEWVTVTDSFFSTGHLALGSLSQHSTLDASVEFTHLEATGI